MVQEQGQKVKKKKKSKYTSSNAVNIRFEKLVTEIINIDPIPDHSERSRIIEELNTAYLHETGTTLPSQLVHILTDWYLTEVFADRDVYKVTRTEYPILSDKQLKRRERECATTSEVTDFLNLLYKENKSSLKKTTKKDTRDI